MSEVGARKIGFLKAVKSENVDRKKLDVIESIKVKTNEYDERVLDKSTIHHKGRLHIDVVPPVFWHQQKLLEARQELNNI